MATFLDRCYDNASQMFISASNMAFLLGSIDKLCHERSELSPEDITEVQNTTEVQKDVSCTGY